MSKSTRLILAAVLAAVAWFLPYTENFINVGGSSIVEILEMEEPSEDAIKANEKIDTIITGPRDRAVVALFNNEFSQRILGYEATGQNYNNAYVKAAKTVFGGELSGKYDGLSEFVQARFESSIGDKDGYITEEERKSLSENLHAQAWILGQ